MVAMVGLRRWAATAHAAVVSQFDGIAAGIDGEVIELIPKLYNDLHDSRIARRD